MVKFKRFIEDIAYVAGTFGSEMHVVRSGQISVHPLHHGAASAHGGIKVPIGYAAFFRHGFHGFYQTGQDGVSLHFAVYGSGHVRRADEEETSIGGQFPEIFNLSFQAGHVIVDTFFSFQVRNGISAILQDDKPDVFASGRTGDSVDEWMPVNIVPEQPRMGMLSSETPVCPSSITPVHIGLSVDRKADRSAGTAEITGIAVKPVVELRFVQDEGVGSGHRCRFTGALVRSVI